MRGLGWQGGWRQQKCGGDMNVGKVGWNRMPLLGLDTARLQLNPSSGQAEGRAQHGHDPCKSGGTMNTKGLEDARWFAAF